VGTEDYYRQWEQSVDGPFDPFATGPNSAANSRVNSAAYNINNNNNNGYYNSSNGSNSNSRVNSGAMSSRNEGLFPVYDPQQYQYYEPEIVEVIAIPLDR